MTSRVHFVEEPVLILPMNPIELKWLIKKAFMDKLRRPAELCEIHAAVEHPKITEGHIAQVLAGNTKYDFNYFTVFDRCVGANDKIQLEVKMLWCLKS